MGTPVVSGEVDTASILKQVQMVKSELIQFKENKHVQDLQGLRNELMGHTDKEVTSLRNEMDKKISTMIEDLRHELDRLRAEFETFKNRDFKDLEARVTALEKKLQRLMDVVNNLRMPESTGGGVSEEAFRELAQKVADLEDALNQLRKEFAHWMKEMQDSLN